MGLDQWAYIQLPVIPELSEDPEIEYTSQYRITQWRKHPNLQGWMERLWQSKGSPIKGWDQDEIKDRDFNCVDLELTEEDITQLEQDITNGNLNGGGPDTTGFFFGDPSDTEYIETDLKFCKYAKASLKAGVKVYYTSWW